MNDGLLSQEEIDALLNGGVYTPALSESDKDLLGEIGNISMGSASTALSTIIGKMVNITTPRVSVTTLEEIKTSFEVPNIALEVVYTEGLEGENLLLMKITDAAIIADLMMGGTGHRETETLSEIEVSAVSEAMNQMIGSAATSLSTMLNIPINISPPVAKLCDGDGSTLSNNIDEREEVVRISFRLTIDVLIDSEIMLLLSMNTAKAIIGRMSGNVQEDIIEEKPFIFEAPKPAPAAERYYEEIHQPAIFEQPKVQRAEFAPLTSISSKEQQNIDLILDVPLEISVVLGKTKKTIKEILSLSSGSLIELDKLTEEPVEILVNGKKVALGEVVVVDENFGVRITNIISGVERVKSLQGK